MTPTWIVMPVVNGRDLTIAALSDCLAQSVPTNILIVGQGCDSDLRAELERISEAHPDRVFCWWHTPPLPSLSSTWNRCLRFVWEAGGTEALVCNNDLRLAAKTIEVLQDVRQLTGALFVSAVGVGEDEYKVSEVFFNAVSLRWTGDRLAELAQGRGGPDFSCFLISREGHEKYPFDEAFIPAFAEDLDMHRRYMLGGDGDRIFSINLPFHHVGGGSQTLKSQSPEARAAWEAKINQGSRAHYRSKWGGDVNAERLTVPFDLSTDQDGVTTPELQRTIQGS